MLKTHPCRCAENPALPMFSARPSPISMRASSQIACPLKWACVARCAENPPLPMFSARPFLRTCLLYHARESTANPVVWGSGFTVVVSSFGGGQKLGVPSLRALCLDLRYGGSLSALEHGNPHHSSGQNNNVTATTNMMVLVMFKTTQQKKKHASSRLENRPPGKVEAHST